MKVFCYAIAAVALAFGATAANATCTLTSFEISNGQVFASYDPFEASASPVAVPLRSSGSGDCAGDSVGLKLEADPSTPFAVDGTIQLRSGSYTLVARLGDSSGRPLTSLFSGGRANASLRLGATGEIRSGDLTLILSPGQQVPPGTYSARFIATAAVRNNDGGENAARQTPFGISVVVVPAVGLAAGSSTTLDLGTIHDGGSAQQPVSFRAYANTGYRLTLTSDNDFALTLNGAKKGARIDYVPVLGQKQVTPGAAGIPFSDPGGAGSREHVLNVSIPHVGRPPAGTYGDYITVEISADVAG
jgi:hypothetical protein